MNLNNINNLIPEGVSAGIYKITAPDGHYYIGSTNNLKERVNEHFYELRKGTKLNSLWLNKYNAHLDWIWKYELLEQVYEECQLIDIEQKHLNIHYGKPLCMNINPKAGKPPSPKGRKQTAEHIAKRGDTQKGKLKPGVSIAKKNKPAPWVRVANALRKGKPTSLRGTGKKYTFTHDIHGTFLTSIPDLLRRFPDLKLHADGLSRVVKGKIKPYKGWAVLV